MIFAIDTEMGMRDAGCRIRDSGPVIWKDEAVNPPAFGEHRRLPSRTFEDLHVWQKAHGFVLGVYRFTDRFPANEQYGLSSQFRRAAVSIPANIAEGFRKSGVADKKRFMNIAQGSLEECRYYLILARDLGYGDTVELVRLLEQTSRLLAAYTRAIEIPGPTS